MLYTEVVRQGRRTAALSIIRDVVANIVGLEILTEDDYPIVYLVFEDHAVPVAVAGDGVQALVRTCLELAATPGGIVLLEEPEVHQHPRAIWQTARAIWSAVSRGVQVVLSTHSLDLIDALLSVDAEPGALDKLALYRVILENGELKSSRLTGFQAAEARSIIEEDLR
ncbi:MAG: AAA family ATPase [Actinomycetota bacterium]